MIELDEKSFAAIGDAVVSIKESVTLLRFAQPGDHLSDIMLQAGRITRLLENGCLTTEPK